MNGKKARALRKEVGFKTTDARKYEPLVIATANGRIKTVARTKVNHEESSRAKYQVAKGRGQ